MATNNSAAAAHFHKSGEAVPSSPPCSSSSSAAGLAMRAQKKILGKLSNRGVVKHLLDEQITRSIDNFHKVLLLVYPPTTANKSVVLVEVIKNMLKVIIKLAVLAKEKCFTAHQQATLHTIENQFRDLTLTVLSFQAVDYSYDYAFLLNLLKRLKTSIGCIVCEMLSDKSMGRVDFVFQLLSQKHFLDVMFCADTPKECLVKLTSDLEKLFENHLTA